MAPTNYKMVPRAAVARADACQAIEHDKHDLSLRLTKEEDTNSVRQYSPEMLARGNEIRNRYLLNPKSVSRAEIDSVPMIAYEFRETEDGYESTTTDYNSMVDVNEDRLLNPSTSNGGKTSRYGKGRSMMLAKRDPTQTHKNSATWHKAGDSKAYGYTGPDIQGRDIHNVTTEPGLPSNDVQKAWFRSESYIDIDTLEKAKTPRELGAVVREILLMTTNQVNIDTIRRSIKVVDKNGATAFEDNSWDGNWKCWEENVMSNKKVFKLWPKNRKEIGPNAFVETQHYQMLEEDPNIARMFPNYGHPSFADSRGFLFLGDEMVEDCPAYVMANLAPHPASQASFGVIVRFMNADGTADNVDVLPTPATIKIQFLNQCKIFKKAMEAIRDSRPNGWIKYDKSQSPKRKPAAAKQVVAPTVPTLPQTVKTVQETYPDEKWVTTKNGLSVEGEQPRKANESDSAYMKRVAVNRYSRTNKKQKRELTRSAATSPVSVARPDPLPAAIEVSHVDVPEMVADRPAEVPTTAPTPVDEDLQWVNENIARLRRVLARADVMQLLG